MSSRWDRWRRVARVSRLLPAVLLLAVACSPRERRAVDERCESDWDCASEMCVMFPFLGARCVQRCGTDEHCPPEQRCTGRAAGSVPYCEAALP